MIVDNGKYFLYRHIREDKNEPFYIGIGTKRPNLKKHRSKYYRAYTPDSRTTYWRNIALSIKYNVEILLESDDRDFIFEKEKEFILLYGRKDLGTGTLVNVCEGGALSNNFFKKAEVSLNKSLETKRRNGTLGNYKNLKKWIDSPNYVHSTAKPVYVYSSINGALIQKFKSMQSVADFIGLKGSTTYLTKRCNNNIVYKNKYVFSWDDLGEKADLSNFNTTDYFYRPVNQVCPKTGEILNYFDSITLAAKHIGGNHKNISEATITGFKSYGYYWKPTKQR